VATALRPSLSYGVVWPCVFSRWPPVGNVLKQQLGGILDGLAAERIWNQLAQAFAERTARACRPSCGPTCEPNRCAPDCAPSCTPSDPTNEPIANLIVGAGGSRGACHRPHPAGLAGLTPLFWTHVLPYGEVKLHMTSRLILCAANQSLAVINSADPVLGQALWSLPSAGMRLPPGASHHPARSGRSLGFDHCVR
jgi:hypothetical protein